MDDLDDLALLLGMLLRIVVLELLGYHQPLGDHCQRGADEHEREAKADPEQLVGKTGGAELGVTDDEAEREQGCDSEQHEHDVLGATVGRSGGDDALGRTVAGVTRVGGG